MRSAEFMSDPVKYRHMLTIIHGLAASALQGFARTNTPTQNASVTIVYDNIHNDFCKELVKIWKILDQVPSPMPSADSYAGQGAFLTPMLSAIVTILIGSDEFATHRIALTNWVRSVNVNYLSPTGSRGELAPDLFRFLEPEKQELMSLLNSIKDRKWEAWVQR